MNGCFASTRPLAWGLILGLLAACVPATGESRPPVRYLFLVDTSARMAGNKAAIGNAIGDRVGSGLDGQMRPGDVFVIWTYDQNVVTNAYLPAAWTRRNRQVLGKRLVRAFEDQFFQGEARLEPAIEQVLKFGGTSPALTVVVINDGMSQLTGWDAKTHAVGGAPGEAKGGAGRLFATTLLMRAGQVTGWSVEPLAVTPAESKESKEPRVASKVNTPGPAPAWTRDTVSTQVRTSVRQTPELQVKTSTPTASVVEVGPQGPAEEKPSAVKTVQSAAGRASVAPEPASTAPPLQAAPGRHLGSAPAAEPAVLGFGEGPAFNLSLGGDDLFGSSSKAADIVNSGSTEPWQIELIHAPAEAPPRTEINPEPRAEVAVKKASPAIPPPIKFNASTDKTTATPAPPKAGVATGPTRLPDAVVPPAKTQLRIAHEEPAAVLTKVPQRKNGLQARKDVPPEGASVTNNAGPAPLRAPVIAGAAIDREPAGRSFLVVGLILLVVGLAAVAWLARNRSREEGSSLISRSLDTHK